jgi:hypothetical protein
MMKMYTPIITAIPNITAARKSFPTIAPSVMFIFQTLCLTIVPKSLRKFGLCDFASLYGN